MSYPEKRKGVHTGVWIGERVIDGKVVRFRSRVKAAADKWEAIVDATGKAPMDGTGASIPHPLGAVAKEARANREGWKGSHDASLDQRLEVVLHYFGPQFLIVSRSRNSTVSYRSLRRARAAMGASSTPRRSTATSPW